MKVSFTTKDGKRVSFSASVADKRKKQREARERADRIRAARLKNGRNW